jgi:hypothetical protein
MSPLILFKRALTLCLCVAQLLTPTVVLGVTSLLEEPSLNRLTSSAIYQARRQTGPEGSVACIDVIADRDGTFHLTLDPSLYQENLSLFLLHQQKAVGALSYRQQSLYFCGFEGNSFVWHQDTLTPLLDAFHAQVFGSLTVTKGDFSGVTSLQARTLSLEGSFKGSDLVLKAKSFFHKGFLQGKTIQLEVEEGVDDATSDLQAEETLILRGYKTYRHQGRFRAQKAIFLEGKDYEATSGSHTFTGVAYSVKALKYADAGRLVSKYTQINAQRLYLQKGFAFLGHYFQGSARENLTTDPESLVEGAYAIQADSQGRLSHKGRFYIVQELERNFPLWEYHLNAGQSYTLPPALFEASFKPIWAQMRKTHDTFRSAFEKSFKHFSGISFSSKGLLEQKGTAYTTNGSVTYKGSDLYFVGQSQSGFMKDNKTLIEAFQSYCEGLLRSPHLLQVQVKDTLLLGGVTVSDKTEVESTHAFLSGQITGNISVSAHNTVLSGQVRGDMAAFLSKTFEQTETGSFDVSKVLFIKADEAHLKGETLTHTLFLDAPLTRMDPTSFLHIKGPAHLEAPHLFHNRGEILSEGAFHLTIGLDHTLGHIHGKDWFLLESPFYMDVEGLLRGDYPDFVQHRGLHLLTDFPVLIQNPIHVPWGIGLTAPQMMARASMVSLWDLHLQTTRGPLDLLCPVMGETVSLSSSSTLTTSDVFSGKDARLQAAGHYTHYGRLYGPNGTTAIEAASILNAQDTSQIIASSLTLQATQGDIINYGLFQGTTYLEKKASGRDIQRATIRYQGHVPYFHKAQSIGGSGIPYQDDQGQTRLLGLKVEAQAIDNTASDYLSEGDLFLKGHQGISHQAKSVSYLAHESHKKSGFLKSKKTASYHYRTALGEPHILSTNGRIFSYAPEGGLEYRGATVSGKDGDLAVVRDQIRYWHLTFADRHETRSSRLWGLAKSSASVTQEQAVLTKLINGSEIDHTSLLKGIHGTAVFVQAPVYRGRAQEKIVFDGATLHHHVSQKTSSKGFGIAGLNLLMAKPKDLLQEVPLLPAVQRFRGAQGPSERFAATVQGGVQAWNLLGQTLNGTLTGNLFHRLGNVGIQGQKTHTRTHITSVVPSMFDVDVLDLQAPQIELLDGIQARIRDLFKVRTTSLKIAKATTSTASQTTSSSWNLGMNLFTHAPAIGGGKTSHRSTQVQHTYAHIDVYGPQGTFDVGDLPALHLEGAHLNAAFATGHIHALSMTSPQDTFTSQTNGFSVGITQGTQGSLSFQRTRQQAPTTPDHSSFVLQNADPQTFQIDHLTVSDTHLNPNLFPAAQTVRFHQQRDFQSQSGFSVSLSDLSLASADAFWESLKTSARAASLGIATATLTRHLGGNDLLSSALGTLATLGVSQEQTASPHPWGLSVQSLGEISYTRPGQQTHLVLLGMQPPVPSFSVPTVESWPLDEPFLPEVLPLVTEEDDDETEDEPADPSGVPNAPSGKKPSPKPSFLQDWTEALDEYLWAHLPHNPQTVTDPAEDLRQWDTLSEDLLSLQERLLRQDFQTKMDFLLDQADESTAYAANVGILLSAHLANHHKLDERGRIRAVGLGYSGTMPSRFNDTPVAQVKAYGSSQLEKTYQAQNSFRMQELSSLSTEEKIRTGVAYTIDALGVLDLLALRIPSTVGYIYDTAVHQTSRAIENSLLNFNVNRRTAQHIAESIEVASWLPPSKITNIATLSRAKLIKGASSLATKVPSRGLLHKPSSGSLLNPFDALPGAANQNLAKPAISSAVKNSFLKGMGVPVAANGNALVTLSSSDLKIASGSDILLSSKGPSGTSHSLTYTDKTGRLQTQEVSWGKQEVPSSTTSSNASRSSQNSHASGTAKQGLDFRSSDFVPGSIQTGVEHPASSAISRLQLRENLIHQQQLQEVGRITSQGGLHAEQYSRHQIFQDVIYYQQKYGGEAKDWVKKSSTRAHLMDKIEMETHWVENLKTGDRFDFKVVKLNTTKAKK